MGNAGVNTPATSEPTTGPGVSFVELWDGASEIVWTQEEPANMGAWRFVQELMQPVLEGAKRTLRYAG